MFKKSIILASRISSNRLKNKALLKINNKPMLELIINRLKTSSVYDNIILATTEDSMPYFFDIIKKTNIDHYVGSNNDVLGRYYKAACEFNSDIIVRATGDNPFVCVESLDNIILHHINTNADLSHYSQMPWGSGVEVISFGALEKSYLNAKENYMREHITQYFYKNKDKFKIEEPIVNKKHRGDIRLTVDTKDDYDFVLSIFNKYNSDFVSICDIINSIKKSDSYQKIC